MNPKNIIPYEDYNIIITKYKEEPIYKLWPALNSVDDEIFNITSTNNSEYYSYIYDPLEESLVIISLIKSKPLKERLSLLEYLKETREYYLSEQNKEIVEYYSRQVTFFQKTFM